MNSLVNKYISSFQKAQGSELDKVKYILMTYAHSWDWLGQDALINDLIDDQNITAETIMDLFENIYAVDGGNKEFSSALKAMKVCLQKAKMHDAKSFTEEEGNLEDIDGNEDSEGFGTYISSSSHFLKHQPLSH